MCPGSLVFLPVVWDNLTSHYYFVRDTAVLAFTAFVRIATPHGFSVLLSRFFRIVLSVSLHIYMRTGPGSMFVFQNIFLVRALPVGQMVTYTRSTPSHYYAPPRLPKRTDFWDLSSRKLVFDVRICSTGAPSAQRVFLWCDSRLESSTGLPFSVAATYSSIVNLSRSPWVLSVLRTHAKSPVCQLPSSCPLPRSRLATTDSGDPRLCSPWIPVPVLHLYAKTIVERHKRLRISKVSLSIDDQCYIVIEPTNSVYTRSQVLQRT